MKPTNPQRILLPIDVTRCPLEVFTCLNPLARGQEITVILLHVVHLSIFIPENRVFRELAAEARSYLERLAQQHLPPSASPISHVRIGEPTKEILAEAHAVRPDLVILPCYGPSFWSRLRAVWRPAPSPTIPPLAEKVLREARCGVCVFAATTRFNCAQAWG